MSNKAKRKTIAKTLVVGQTVLEFDLLDGQLYGIFVDANLTGTVLTIKGSTAAGGTFTNVIDNTGSAVATYTVAASKYLALSQLQRDLFAGLQHITITSGTTQATADSVLTVVTKQLT